MRRHVFGPRLGRRRQAYSLVSLCAWLLLACGDPPATQPAARPEEAARAERPVVLFLGTSLTAGYGMQYRENFLHHSLEVPGLHGRGGICALLPPLLARVFELRKLWMLMGRL